MEPYKEILMDLQSNVFRIMLQYGPISDADLSNRIYGNQGFPALDITATLEEMDSGGFIERKGTCFQLTLKGVERASLILNE